MAIRQRYVETVTLDGSGSGAVEITARGDFALAHTRWVVQPVAPATTLSNQSSATNTINGDDFEGTYSGNNDSSNTGHLMLAGDTLRCEWTGGDPGARATLTLRGLQYNAGEGVEATSGSPLGGGAGPGNPILGGTTLIRDAIQSSNFVSGSSGWAIFRDGSYELGPGGAIRGDVEVTDPDGSGVRIQAGTGGRVQFVPPDNPGVTVNDPGQIFSGVSVFGPNDVSAFMTLSTPDVTAGTNPSPGQLFIAGARTSGLPFSGFPVAKRLVETGGDLQVNGITWQRGDLLTEGVIQSNIDDMVYGRGQADTKLVSFAAATSNSTAVVFPKPFPVGVTPFVDVGIVSAPGSTARWTCRPINITNLGFDIFSSRTDAADPAVAWANVPVQWKAVVF